MEGDWQLIYYHEDLFDPAEDRQLAQRERSDGRAAQLQTMPKVGRIASLTYVRTSDS